MIKTLYFGFGAVRAGTVIETTTAATSNKIIPRIVLLEIMFHRIYKIFQDEHVNPA
jgi:hypothetical protein